MALVQTDTELWFHAQGVEGDLTIAGGQINANNGGLAWIFQAEETATITRISLRVSAIATTPSASLEGFKSSLNNYNLKNYGLRGGMRNSNRRISM